MRVGLIRERSQEVLRRGTVRRIQINRLEIGSVIARERFRSYPGSPGELGSVGHAAHGGDLGQVLGFEVHSDLLIGI